MIVQASRIIFLSAIALACASGPKQMYDGPPRPRDEVAMLEAETGTNVFAIDNTRVSGNSWILLPGSHHVWVKAAIAGSAPGVRYKGWSYCAFQLEASGGETYRSVVEKHETAAGALGKQVEMDIRIVDPEGSAVAYANDCTGQRPRLSY